MVKIRFSEGTSSIYITPILWTLSYFTTNLNKVSCFSCQSSSYSDSFSNG